MSRHAFRKIVCVAGAVQKLENTRKSLPGRRNQNDYIKKEERRSMPVSASNLARDIQKAAMQQTLDILKGEKRDCDAILKYVKYELFGRQLIQHECDLTDYHHDLMRRFTDNADSLEDIYDAMDDLDDDPEAEGGLDSLLEQEAHLESERNNIVELVQKELG
jgi:hypothetical protein